MWEEVYASSQERGLSKSASAAQAWCAVKRYYYKKKGRWLRRKKPIAPDKQPPGCTPSSAYRRNTDLEYAGDDALVDEFFDDLASVVEVVANPAVDEDSIRDDYLYHVTYDGRLPSIAEEGLRPGKERSIGSASYDAHRRGAIFFTEADGVSFWFDRGEQWAFEQSDETLSDELTPVVLRVAEDTFIEQCVEDVHGTNDSGHLALRCKTHIEPEEIELWNGTAWVDVDEGVDPNQAYDPWTDRNGNLYYSMLSGEENPLFPTDDDMDRPHSSLESAAEDVQAIKRRVLR